MYKSRLQNNNNLKVQNTIFALALFIFLFLNFDKNVKKKIQTW